MNGTFLSDHCFVRILFNKRVNGVRPSEPTRKREKGRVVWMRRDRRDRRLIGRGTVVLQYIGMQRDRDAEGGWKSGKIPPASYSKWGAAGFLWGEWVV